MSSETTNAENVNNTTIEVCGKEFAAGDTVDHHEDLDKDVVEACDEMLAADADRYGNVRKAIWETPDGDYLHVSYRTDSSQIFERTPGRGQPKHGTCYSIHQVGNELHTELLSGEEQEVVHTDLCVNYVIGDWGGVYGAHAKGDIFSLSALMDGWEDDQTVDVDELRAAGKHDITFRVDLR